MTRFRSRSLLDSFQNVMSSARLFRIRKANFEFFSRSQVEPALAILCACLITLRPLFIDLNLILPRFSTHFSRSKSSLFAGASSCIYTSKEGDSHLQWPDTQIRRGNNPTPSFERMDKKRGIHIVTVDQGATVEMNHYMQV